jgi:hypothetical protein
MKFILPISLLTILIGCNNPMNNKDVVFKKCVIDSTSVREPRSTIEIDKTYYYHTDCGQSFLSKSDSYDIGDTITFYYYKTKKGSK